MKVLVTGGAGFIGSHVVDALISAGTEVRVLDSLNPAAHDGPPSYLNEGAEVLWGDLRDEEVVTRSAAGIDAVCHQAALVGLGESFADVTDYVAHNDLGTATLLKALGRSGFRGRFVLASSMVVYGEGSYRCRRDGPVRPGPRSEADLVAGRFDPRCPRCEGPLRSEAVTEDALLDPRSVYAATKLHQEHLAGLFGRELGVPVTALRYHNVYGPRMPRDTLYSGVAAIFRSALERREAPEVFEDGRQTRDFVAVTDVVRANLLALSRDPAPTGPFNVCSGDPHTVGEVAMALSEAFEGEIRPRVTGAFRLGDVRHVFASPARAAADLGFTARIGLSAGMNELARAPLGHARGGLVPAIPQ